VKRPREGRGFGLTLDLPKSLLCGGGERGTIVPYGLHTISDETVTVGWHTTVAALVTGIFLPPSFYWGVQ
jgi:hypothetical protein